ncbi:MAG TPA: pyridoxamine 5'-phosphate oxidase family protein [Acidimicrobiales bacterium]|nr:pyridoxamine 5'-phosphate oxidase family protein [Acidimicrobiales bacterium]
MGKSYDQLTAAHRDFVEAQHLFFVATAPLAADGHVNLSPKGYDSFRVIDEHTVAYLDLTGSGVETIAHVRENGRITLMFCAFEGQPKIVRLQGRGEAVLPADDAFEALAARFPTLPGTRAVIVVHLDRISSSCGFSIPLYSYEGEREQLVEWAEKRGPEGVAEYHATRNAASIDGLPAVTPADVCPSTT